MDQYHVVIYNTIKDREALQFIINIIDNDYENNSNTEDIVNEFYEEQLTYFNLQDKDSYFFAVISDKNEYIGGVFLFLDTRERTIIDTPSPGFQAIAKSIIGLQSNVKINSLLIPVIVNFLRERDYEYVYVNPVNNQRKILENYYNFTPYLEESSGEIEDYGVLCLKL